MYIPFILKLSIPAILYEYYLKVTKRLQSNHYYTRHILKHYMYRFNVYLSMTILCMQWPRLGLQDMITPTQ